MTGKTSDCVLIDGTVRNFPMARINVGTPVYTGELDVMVMNDPVFDLVIGNVPGLQEQRNSDSEEDPSAVDAHSQDSALETPVGAGVETRGEVQRISRPIRPLVTPEVKVDEIGADQLKELQRSDPTLEKLFAMAKA